MARVAVARGAGGERGRELARALVRAAAVNAVRPGSTNADVELVRLQETHACDLERHLMEEGEEACADEASAPFVIEVELQAGRGVADSEYADSSPSGRSALRGVATKASALAMCGEKLKLLLCEDASARAAVLSISEVECFADSDQQPAKALTESFGPSSIEELLSHAEPGSAWAPSWTSRALRESHGFTSSCGTAVPSRAFSMRGGAENGDAHDDDGFAFVRSVSHMQLRKTLELAGHFAEETEAPLHPILAMGDPLDLAGIDELVALATEILCDQKVHEVLGVGRETVHRYVVLCSEGYHAGVPFHNFRHGVSVMQIAAAAASMGGLHDRVSDLELSVLLLAALGHDMGHVGLDNTFIRATNSPLWRAPRPHEFGSGALEAMHAKKMTRALRESGVLKALSARDADEFVSHAKGIVAATDMQQHEERLGASRRRAEALAEEGVTDVWSDAQYRAAVLELVMKSSDIGAEVRGHRATIRWVELLLAEFAQQHVAESILDLPHGFVTAFAQAHLEAEPTKRFGAVPDMQQKWLSDFTLPLFDELAVAMPATAPMREAVVRAQELWSGIGEAVE